MEQFARQPGGHYNLAIPQYEADLVMWKTCRTVVLSGTSKL
jgi:hypothetical protein